MSGHRHAAVALQGLGQDDRQAILNELPVADRQVLLAYLAELDELGFDCGSVTEAIAAPSTGVAPHDRLWGANAAEMHALLAGEPPACVAAVMAMDNWPWAPDLLSLCDPAARRAIEAARPVDGPPPALLRAWLSGELSRRLGPRQRTDCPPQSRVERLRQRLIRWIQ